jgi:hypothetical protein
VKRPIGTLASFHKTSLIGITYVHGYLQQVKSSKAGTTTLSLQMIQNSAKIYFMITMVKGHMYYKYGQSDAQLNHLQLL